MKHFKRLTIALLALLSVSTGAWAQTEELLVTINSNENRDFTSGSKTFDNIATVTFSTSVTNDGDEWGWWQEVDNTITVTAANDDYTITRVKFFCRDGSAFDEAAPFEALVTDEDAMITKVNGTSIGGLGVTKIEVYGIAPASGPEVTLNDTKTIATMTMPESDVTVSYDLVRDLTQQVAFSGIPTGDGLIVKKNGEVYDFATAPEIALNDALISGNDKNIIAAQGITVTTQKKGEGDQWETLDEAALQAGFAPGTYRLVATANADGPYDGQVTSAEFTTIEKYDLLVQPADDFSKGKVDVTVGGTAVTLDADGTATTTAQPAAEVKLKTKRGYVIEKVEAGKPKPKPLLTLTVVGKTIYYVEGETWREAITNHPTENAGWSIGGNNGEWVVNGGLNLCNDEYDTIHPDTVIDSGFSYKFT